MPSNMGSYFHATCFSVFLSMKQKKVLDKNSGHTPDQAGSDSEGSALERFRQQKRRRQPKADDYIRGILDGDRVMLSRAITFLESEKALHRAEAQKVIAACYPHSGRSVRIAITGVPGVGKSTFIEAFGKHLIHCGKRVAVLAIDPSSERSGGSILGDKTRMENLANHNQAFVRPSPSGGSLGGVARRTRECIVLCEAAGYDVILVETVGVGQSETAAYSMVDFFLLLMLAGAGDELQGIKRGIMEMADMVAINKADGDNIKNAEQACTEYNSALHLLCAPDSGWRKRTLTCSAYRETGIEDIWVEIMAYVKHTKDNGYFEATRQRQNIRRMHEHIKQSLEARFYDNQQMNQAVTAMEKDVLERGINSYQAAEKLLEVFKGLKD